MSTEIRRIENKQKQVNIAKQNMAHEKWKIGWLLVVCSPAVRKYEK